MASLRRAWLAVAADPAPFLSLRLADPRWLGGTIPKLIKAADTCELRGDQVLHLDVRSDSLCFRDDAALHVDWNHAAIGNPRIDLAF